MSKTLLVRSSSTRTKRVGRRVYAVCGDDGGEPRTRNYHAEWMKRKKNERIEHRTRTTRATRVVNSERTHGLRRARRHHTDCSRNGARRRRSAGRSVSAANDRTMKWTTCTPAVPAVTAARWWAPAKAVARRTGAATLRRCTIARLTPVRVCVRSCISVNFCGCVLACNCGGGASHVRRGEGEGAASGPTRVVYSCVRRRKLYTRAMSSLSLHLRNHTAYPPQHRTHPNPRLKRGLTRLRLVSAVVPLLQPPLTDFSGYRRTLKQIEDTVVVIVIIYDKKIAID